MARSRTVSIRTAPRRRGRRLAGLLLIAASCASLAIVPAAGAQAEHGSVASSFTPRSAASVFCAHFSATKVSSIVGAKVSLFEAIPEGTSLECIFEGAREVIISRKSPVPVVTTLAKAEAGFKAASPKGVKITFTAVPSLGPTAFSWSYTDNGGLLVGIGNNKNTTAWGAVVGASVKIMGSPTSHVAAVVHLVQLDMAA